MLGIPLAAALAMMVFGPGIKMGQVSAGSLPDTPAGRELAGWLTAFNTGDRETIRRFFRSHSEKPPSSDEVADSHVALYRTDGAYTVQSIVASSPTSISVDMQAHPTGCWVQIDLTVTDAPPGNITGFRYRHIEMPAELLPHKRLNQSEIRRKTDALLDHLIAADQFSGVILIAKDNKPFYVRTSGQASRAWGISNRADTRFNVASIGKMFTAVAIAQLVEQGKLSYNDTVGELLPDYPNKDVAGKVRVRHLLTHTSGLGSKSMGMLQKGFRQISEYVPSFVNDPLHFEPGERYDYSNDGYLLLGCIIEKVTGQKYDDYLRDHIFRVAGMLDTDNYELDADPHRLAAGYMSTAEGERRNNIFALPIKGLPFGLGYATAGDLLKFTVALRHHRLINAESLDTMWTGKADEGDHVTSYGYGFDIKRYNGVRIIGHSGGWAGVTNQFDIYPDLGYTVVILTNIDDSPRSLAYKLHEWLTQGYP